MARHISSVSYYARRAKHIHAPTIVAIIVTIIVVCGALLAAWLIHGLADTPSDFESKPDVSMQRRYPMETSSIDYDGDGIDDYTDILDGARKDAQAAPTYDNGYYQGGYPPADRGACTDVVWRAFAEAGYDLKSMVDADIAAYPADYESVITSPDPNIDFRRTGVLDVFFGKYAQSLTTDTTDVAAWQGGDIVVFEHTRHIGVVSDRRDENGLTYVIHNMGQKQRENDYFSFRTHMAVTAHYRFDASQIPQDVLRAWTN